MVPRRLVGGGADANEGKAGRYPWQPSDGKHPCVQPPIGTITLTVSMDTYLPDPLLTKTKSCQEGGWSGSEIP